MNSLINLILTHSLNQSITKTLTHALAHSLTHSHTHSLTHSLFNSLTLPSTQSLTHSHTHSLTHTLTHLRSHSPLPYLRNHNLSYSLNYSLTITLKISLTHSFITTMHKSIYFSLLEIDYLDHTVTHPPTHLLTNNYYLSISLTRSLLTYSFILQRAWNDSIIQLLTRSLTVNNLSVFPNSNLQTISMIYQLAHSQQTFSFIHHTFYFFLLFCLSKFSIFIIIFH